MTRKQKRKAANGREDKIVENPVGSGKYPWRVTVGIGPDGQQLRCSGTGDSHAAASVARDEASVPDAGRWFAAPRCGMDISMALRGRQHLADGAGNTL